MSFLNMDVDLFFELQRRQSVLPKSASLGSQCSLSGILEVAAASQDNRLQRHSKNKKHL